LRRWSRARRRLDALGYDNVALRVADGTLGWSEAAPFDAIVVSAGAPAAPDALKAQLAHGGRLVIPIGPRRGGQHLLRITRTDAEHYGEEDLGLVIFVPLIGVQGWAEEARNPGKRARTR
jgi:protein-L-isoaspartate(D-aspartate) O-methyltransferase